MLKMIRFRVQNFRNIDDSGWVPVERITALVGRNESGKTALLKALHKFNPATPEPYNPQREFPRDRYTRDFKNPADWPVCSVGFEINEQIRSELQGLVGDNEVPTEAICTRYYDGSLEIEFDPDIPDEALSPDQIVTALETFAKSARRIEASTPEQEEATQALRTRLANWASDWESKIKAHADLHSEEGVKLLSTLRRESENYSNPQTAG